MHRQIAGKLTGPVIKWLVPVFWLVLLVGGGFFASKLTDVQNNEASSWLPATAESTQVFEKLAPFQDQNDIPTVVLYERAGGLTAADLTALKGQAAEFANLEGVTGEVVGPIPSPDGEAAQSIVTFNFGKDGWNAMPDAVDEIDGITGTLDGVTVYVTGPGGQAADSAEAFASIDGTLLGATLLVVALILLLTYRSPLLWILPIGCAVTSLLVAEGVVYLLAKYADLTVNGQSQSILTVLVIGAGTDYALLLVARYREELRNHEDRHEAMAFALHRAAPAIFASAGTVILGMLCLLLAEMNSTAGLGPVAAVGILVSLLVMVTLLPALLVIFGRWIFWPKRPTFGSAEPTSTGLWARVGNWIAPRPRRVWVVTSAILGVACLGILTLSFNGLSTEDTYTKDFDSVTGQAALIQHGMADQSNPLSVVANADQAQEVRSVLADIDGLDSPAEAQVKDGVAYIAAPLRYDPTSEEAFAAVQSARESVHAVDGAEALVGGTSALLFDIEQASHRDNRVIIPVVLLVVLLILMLLLRALVSPLLLIATVLLSFGAALGLSSLLFTYVFGFAGADASLPLFVFVFLVALGIDYNIFLMTRVREETVTRGTREGSLVALAATGGVITSAGIVLAATFLALATLPLVFVVELGVAVALGVMLDTIVVRSVLVTALNLDLGSKIWWPSKLDREPSTSGTADPIPEVELSK